jgi:hypothetical protein
MTGTATWIAAAAAATFVAGSARAEGLAIGVGASTTAAPSGDATATTAPPSTDVTATAPPATMAAPSPAADAPPAASPTTSLPVDKNPANYEFAFVSVGAYQTWAIAGNVLYFGAGGGLGPPLYRYSKLGKNPFVPGQSADAGWDPSLEIAYGNVFLRVAPAKFLDIDIGPKISLGSRLYDGNKHTSDQVDAPTTAFSYGAYVDLRVGTERIKVGPRFEYDRIAYANYYENGWRITPLMLRVVH